MYCTHCGNPNAPGTHFCTTCGHPLLDFAPASSPVSRPLPLAPPAAQTPAPSVDLLPRVQPLYSPACPFCGCPDIAYQTYTAPEKTGCGTIFLYILLAISILGWLILIPLLLRTPKTVLHTCAVCRNCGRTWVVQ